MLHLMAIVALGGLVVVVWLPLLSELLCLIQRRRPVETGTQHRGEEPRLLFLVPAHDEQLLIAECVRSLVNQEYPTSRRRVIVIADNCSDTTAKLAREHGAECMERTDRELTGKPRAIAWALEQIELRDWDACVIVDADSTVAPQFALGLAQLAPLNDIAFQANIGVLNEFENWLTRLGGILSRCRYEITYPLKQSAGLNCTITGNGMGFGTNLLMRDGWRAFSITEDSELYALYTEAGVSIRQAEKANLFSQEARSLGQGVTQRRRWLSGRLGVIRSLGGPLLRSRHISWHQKLDAFVELGLSSPVLHLIAVVIVATAAFVGVRSEAGIWMAALSVGSLSGLVVSTTLVAWRHPQPWRTLYAFLMLPVYAVWRATVAVGTLLTLGDKTWRKTARTAPVQSGGFQPTAVVAVVDHSA